VKGREPQGVIEPSEFERERDKLAERLKTITDPSGRRMQTQAYKPEELYPVSVGDRPDLMVYFDDL
jgi:predicted AlkP superfamily phosphohydrolase/phosphomutase